MGSAATIKIEPILALCCIVFNLFLAHSYLPDSFMDSVIVPLVKCKGGDLTDVNNYRAITLSNAISKIFESVLLDHVNDIMYTVDSQFGFRPEHSTSLCTFSFKQTAEYYTSRGIVMSLSVLPISARLLTE